MTSKSKWLLITIIIQLLLIIFIFRGVLIHPNEYFFEVGSDAVKSLMCMSYYIKYDHGLHFTGEIYPYGDHIIYADSQFPVSYGLQLLKNYLGIDWSGYIPGIVNSSMMWSFIPCVIFIFLILSSFNKRNWFNCFAAIGITMLSPQILRFQGHFSLSHIYFIPMEWYFMMQLMKARNKTGWMIAMFLTVLWFGLAHLYYMAFIMMFAWSFVFIYLLRNRKDFRKAFNASLPLLVASTLPYLFTAVLLKFTDHVTDRVQTPWGFFFDYASFNSVFIPPPYNPLNFLHLKNGTSEGYSYVGIAGILGLLFFLIRLGSRLKGWKHHVFLAPEFLKISLYASILVLIFSFAFPFRFGLESLLDYLGLIKQFRSEGRFAWIFYYVFCVFSVHYIFLHLRAWNSKGAFFASALVLLLMTGTWINDSYWNLRQIINQYKPYSFKKEYYDGHEVSGLLLKAGRSANEFQAVLSLPMYHNGSEKFWFTKSEESLRWGLKAAFDTGLPMIDSHCGRTSLSATMNALQLVSDTLIERNILKDFPSDKPILLVVTHDPLSADEKILISKAKLIQSDSLLGLYELSLSSIKVPFTGVSRQFFEMKDSLRQTNDIFYTSADSPMLFRKILAEGLPFVNGTVKSGSIELFNSSIAIDTSVEWEVSVWNRVFNNSFESPELVVRQYNKNNELVEELVTIPQVNPNNAFGWLRQSLSFKLHDKNNRVEITIRGKKIEANYFLIRPENLNVYYDLKPDGSFWLNNFFIPVSSHKVVSN